MQSVFIVCTDDHGCYSHACIIANSFSFGTSLYYSDRLFTDTYEPQTCCAALSYDPPLEKACNASRYSFPGGLQGVIVINGGSGADIAEDIAGEDWMVLVDGRQGPVHTMNTLLVKKDQIIRGVKVNNTKPVLTYADSDAGHLVDSRVGHFQLINIHLKGAEQTGVEPSGNSPGSLLLMEKPSLNAIHTNIFTPTASTQVAIELTDRNHPDDNCSTPSYRSNEFFLDQGQAGLKIDCRKSNGPHASPFSNYYYLSGSSQGVVVKAGGFTAKNERFIQTADIASENDSPPVAIAYDETAGSTRAFHAARIECSVFDGAEYGTMIPIRLSHATAHSDASRNTVKIAFNRFRNVPYIVDNSHSSTSEVERIADESWCNIWEHTDDSVDRCANMPQDAGIIHFTDGTTCGSLPGSGDNWEAPDCTSLWDSQFYCIAENYTVPTPSTATTAATTASTEPTEPVTVSADPSTEPADSTGTSDTSRPVAVLPSPTQGMDPQGRTGGSSESSSGGYIAGGVISTAVVSAVVVLAIVGLGVKYKRSKNPFGYNQERDDKLIDSEMKMSKMSTGTTLSNPGWGEPEPEPANK